MTRRHAGIHQLPLTSLLSQVLVALTIELDNEYEHRAPHVTSDYGAGAKGPGALLTSTAMYVNFLRFVPDDGIRMRELSAASGSNAPVHRMYHGMRRWRYVTYEPDIAGSSPRPKDGDALVRPTSAGAASRDLWRATFADVEERWERRGLGALRRTLVPAVEAIGRPLPEYLPVVDFDYRMAPIVAPVSRPPAELGLIALTSQALLAMTVDFDATSPLSLCYVQNLLRPLGEEPVPVADLTGVTGIAKKAWGSAVGHVTKPGYAVVRISSPGKAISLTDRGIAARDAGRDALEAAEVAWRKRCGPALDELRTELDKVVGDGTPSSPVFDGMRPYPECWRAKVRPMTMLPHHPLVSHRGGYPDGS